MAMAIVIEQLCLDMSDAIISTRLMKICLYANVVVIRLMKIRIDIVRVYSGRSRRRRRSRNGFRIKMQEAMGMVEIEFSGIRVTVRPWFLRILDILLLRRMMMFHNLLLQILIMMMMMMVVVAVITTTIRIR
jgi:hypothetical protein